jgi:ATP-dependent Clp protease ATP-binding subunit ClpC
VFERYTEPARRIIFFARYEASLHGEDYIDPGHLLLALFREAKTLSAHLLSPAHIASITNSIASTKPELKVADQKSELPLTPESKRVIAYAAEEAERLSHKHIGPEHILLGLLREQACVPAKLLVHAGLDLSSTREYAGKLKAAGAAGAVDVRTVEGFRSLTDAARRGELEVVFGRELEYELVFEVLSSRMRRNPVLVGERGAGKTTLVDGLAKRMEGGGAPPFLAAKAILVLDIPALAAWSADASKVEERFKENLRKAIASGESILFFEDLSKLLALLGPQSSAVELLRTTTMQQEVQWIAATTDREYEQCIGLAPWMRNCCRPVKILPLDEEAIIKVLFGQKHTYEQFHEVAYLDDAVEHAARPVAGTFRTNRF